MTLPKDLRVQTAVTMNLQKKSELELKYFLERRLVSVASGSGNSRNSSYTDLHRGYDDPSRPKNKYQQKQSMAQNKNSPRLKKSSSCNELVLQFEHHMRKQQQFPLSGPYPSPGIFQGRTQMASEVFVDPVTGRQPRRPVVPNRELFEKQLDNNLFRRPDPVQRIVNQHSPDPRQSEKLDGSSRDLSRSSANNQHKVVIYFGDSIGNNRKTSGSVGDLVHASRAEDARKNEPHDVMRQLKSVLEEKKTQKETPAVIKPAPPPPPPMPSSVSQPEHSKRAAAATARDAVGTCEVQVNTKVNKPTTTTVAVKEKPPRKDKLAKQQREEVVSKVNTYAAAEVTPDVSNKEQLNNALKISNDTGKSSVDLPDFVESVTTDGVINIKIDGSFSVAQELVDSVAKGPRKMHSNEGEEQSNEPQSFDWSFVQEWRSR